MSKRKAMVSGSGVDLLTGSGEVRALMRARDWDGTPLGSTARWPSTLRAVVWRHADLPFRDVDGLGARTHIPLHDAYLPTVGG